MLVVIRSSVTIVCTMVYASIRSAAILPVVPLRFLDATPVLTPAANQHVQSVAPAPRSRGGVELSGSTLSRLTGTLPNLIWILGHGDVRSPPGFIGAEHDGAAQW